MRAWLGSKWVFMATSKHRRAPGLIILVGLVGLGMGIPAFLIWRVPQLESKRDQILAEAPTEPEGMVEVWLQKVGRPQIHNALVMARFSAERPWYVSHVVRPDSADEPPEIWGIDFTELPIDIVQRDGMEVYVDLSEPKLLARDVLVGDKAQGVPVFTRASVPADTGAIVRERIEGYLRKLGEGLAEDIRGARLAVRTD